MGNKDRDERIYLRNPAVFADVCNYALFGGENVINPESLREMDTSHIIAMIDKAASYSNLDYDAARLLGKYANISSKEIENARTKNGGVSMCRAWEEHGKEEAAKAVAESDRKWQAKTAELEANYAKALEEIAQLKETSV